MKEIKPVETPQTVMNYQPYYEDTINLAEIFAFFYQWRRTILSITLLGALFATALAYYLPPQYKTTTQLTPPKAFQFNALLANTDLSISADTLFTQFTDQLKSKGNLQAFITQSEPFKKALTKNPSLSESQKIQLANGLAAHYKIINKATNTEGITTNWVNVESTSPKVDLTAQANTAYIEYTSNRVINSLKDEQGSLVNQQITQLNEKITLATQKEKIDRENRIVRLKNDQKLAIAELTHRIKQLTEKDFQQKKLLIAHLTEAYKLARATQNDSQKQRTLVLADNSSTNQNGLQQHIDINLNQPDLYLKGPQYLQKAIEITKAQPHTTAYQQEVVALQHQLNSLKNDPKIAFITQRKNDQAYVADIGKDLTALSHLQHLNFDTRGVQTYNMDNDPEVGVTPFSPNKKLIVVMGTVLGFMLSIFLVVLLGPVREFIAKNK